MFDNPHYITRGVQTEIDPLVQYAMWSMIERMPEPKDYLQIFTLSPAIVRSEQVQQIIHMQEEPEYTSTVLMRCDSPCSQKIFVIDDGDHCTMLLAEEY